MKTTVAIETPLSTNDPADVAVEEIALPPEALWAELDNSAGAPNSDEQAPKPRKKKAVATLQFINGPSRTIQLQYPFIWEGVEVKEITIRRLTVGEFGDVLDTLPEEIDNYEIYAAMTGLPAPVLRGLIDIDGEALVEVGYDFLHPLFQVTKAKTEPEPQVV